MMLPLNSDARSLVAHAGYGTILVAAVAALPAVQAAGLPAERATFVVVLLFTFVLLGIERLLPHSEAWRPTGRSFGLDVVHAVVTGLVVAPVLRALLLASLVLAGARLAEGLGVALWPAHLPLALQVPLALLVSDLGAYSAHRFMHATRVGWRLHAVHHSPVRLNVMASARTHPFNAVLTYACETGPLILLGIAPEALAAWTVFKAVNGLLQHSNIDLRPGWLSHVVATSDVHRYHHSVHLDESNTNFGNTTMIWDRVFGTFHLPGGRTAGLDVGVEDAAIPESYAAHLATPFVLGRYEAAAAGGAPESPSSSAVPSPAVV